MEALWIVVALAAYFVIMRWILPRLGVPTWKGYCSTLLQCRETLFWAHAQVEDGTLPAEQYRRIRSAVRALYVRRHRQTAVRRVRKVTRMAVGRS